MRKKLFGQVGNHLGGLKTARERADHKGRELAKLDISGRLRAGDFEVEIQGLRAIPGGIEYFARVWDANGERVGLGKHGNVDIERFRVFNPPILVSDGTKTKFLRAAEFPGDKDVEVEMDNLKEDLLAALLQDLGHTIKVIPKSGPDKIQHGKIGNTTSTFFPDPDTESTSVDGRSLNSAIDTYANVRDAATGSFAQDNDASNNAFLTQLGGSFFAVQRDFFLFDTSGIGDTDTITAAVISFAGTGSAADNADTSSINIVATTPASDTAITTADYDQAGSTVFASLAISSWNSTDGTYNDLTLDANGIAAVSKTGITKLGGRNSLDVNNTTPLGLNRVPIYYADQTGTTKDPKLVVTHATPTTDPVVFDTVTVSEVTTMMVDENPNVFDSVTITEVVTVFFEELVPFAAEDVTVTEAITMMMDLSISVFDSATITEAVDLSNPLELPTVTEDVTLTEVVTMMVDENPNVFDSVTITEDVTLLITELFLSVFDDVTVTDEDSQDSDVNISVFDAVTITESMAFESTSDISVFDDITITESNPLMADLNPAPFDAVTLTEGGGLTGLIFIADPRRELIHMRSTEQSYPIMMDTDEI